MNNRVVYFFISIVIIYSLFFIYKDRFPETYTQKIENRTFKLLVADTPEEHLKGLMHIEKLDNADGMVFFFNDHKKRTFWNQNTLVDLDVYWLKDNEVLGKSFLPSIRKTKTPFFIYSPEGVNKVVEIIRK